MPIKTTIGEDDFPAILSNYDLGEYRGFETFEYGAGQTTVLLHTTKGNFVLRYYENRPEKHVLFEIQLLNFLQNNNYPAPAIVKDRAGNFSGIYKGKPRVIIELVEGEHCKNPNDFSNKEEVAEVVRVVAQLHNLTKNHRLDFFGDRGVFDADYCWREYHRQSRTKDKEERGKWLKTELEKLELPDTMPKGICHADLNHGNFLFRNGKVATVLDFDMSFYFYLVYDVADLIYWWAFPPQQGFKEADAAFIISEYVTHRKLSEEEQQHIFDALKLIILLGISWSEEDDFESEKKKIMFLNTIGREEFVKKLFSH
ncbi:MAG: phosphotransferase [Parcubacteria group bacterium]|nr:phosphotransferase [Parcubacteria group bacterium]